MMRLTDTFVALLMTSTLLAQGTPERPTFHVQPASSRISIDGILNEQAWQDAVVMPLLWEWNPGDNAPPPVKTDGLITFDRNTIYFGFRATDPRPAEIRANLMDRDSIDTFIQDDHVTVMIDPFNDNRRGFQFRINPLGVQADAIFSQVEGVEDFSWDIIWSSAGRITSEGYEVEVAIPLNQIRFPSTRNEQTWGIEMGRSYPRSVRHRILGNLRDRNNNCILCESPRVTGFRGLEPGRNLEIDPTLTAAQSSSISDFPEGDLLAGDEEIEPGVTTRWGITPALTLNGTINPDFSQVEADAAQLNVNQRFALFFEEKRPFFLEGVDFFTTPLQAVFTRTVVDPQWGLKLSGKEGVHAGGVFITQDEVNSLLIPSNQSSAFAFLEEKVLGSVLRYRHDVGPNATIGVLLTDREGDEYHNRVGGLDGFFRLSTRDELRVQYLRTDTAYPLAIATAFSQPTDSFSGGGLRMDYDHGDRGWFWGVRYEDLEPEFRADYGFIPRVDVRSVRGYLTRRFFPENHPITNSNVGFILLRTEDHAGQLTDEVASANANFSGPKQSFLDVTVQNVKERFADTLYENQLRTSLFFEMQPGAIAKFSLFLFRGDGIDFENNRPADITQATPAVELKLGRHINAQLSHIFQQLDVDGGRLSAANISQLRFVYNFSVRSFARAILQYQTLDQDPELFTFPVDAKTETLFSQLLFSYKLNPQTVLFVGYSDNHLGIDQITLTQTERTFFLKLGYAWIL
jgi:hypothetical protein